jgi:hypothetical protein
MTMMDKQLFIFVEGEDDKRFFQHIVIPMINPIYKTIIKTYAEEKKDKLEKYIKSIQNRYDYIFIADINSSPCIIAKKQRLLEEYNFLDENKTILVRHEIESWYLSGLSDENSKKFKIRILKNTDKITKEVFYKLMKKAGFDSRIDFMVEILNHFSIETAIKKNKSFKYFIDKIFE